MADEASAQAGRGDMVPRADLRAAHEDRDRVVDVLRQAAGDGRLTLDELDERVGAALTARTFGELSALVADLPAVPSGTAGGPEPKEVVRIECYAGTARRDGRWLVPRRIELRVTGGAVTLDFTEAVISWPSLQIDLEALGSSVTLVTRPGILVDTDDLAIRGATVDVRAPRGPEVPVRFRIDLSGAAEGSSVRARPPRRTWWQRLLRRPLPQALPPGRP